MTVAIFSNDQGFTLAEAVMSLMVVSMALAGLLQVTSYNAKSQARIGDHQKILKLMDQQSAALQRILAGATSDQLTGRIDYLGVKDQSGLDRSYRVPSGWRLRYLSDGRMSDEWPFLSEQNIEPPLRQSLGAVVLNNDKNQPVKIVRIRIEQGRDCQFDMISRQCRVVTP